MRASTSVSTGASTGVSSLSTRGQTALGLVLVGVPAVTLVAVFSLTDSAAIASVAALSLSSTLQLFFESRWPARALATHSGRRLAVELFEGVFYGTLLGVGVVFAVAWLVARLKVVLGFDFVLGGSVWGQAVVLVVVADFLDYFRHRHEHESSGLFWRVHSVHHSIREFSLLAGLTLHPLETVFTFTSYGLVTGLLGLPLASTILGFTIAMIAMGAQHTNTPTRLGWLSNVVAHADGHRWHHDRALSSGRNVNYANVFSLWDRLWGSFHPAEPFGGEYGIEPFGDAYPATIAGQARMAFASDYACAEARAIALRDGESGRG